MPEDYESDEEEPSEEDEPDQEELRERARTTRKTKAAAPKQSAPKRAKTNGTTLAMRPAVKRKPAKRSKAVNVETAADAGGLFAEVFGDDVQFEVVAADWLKSFDTHESQALADMVNFILKCAGCHSTTSDFDIEDPDGVTNRLTDIQEEFQATAPTEYPLIAKGKAGTAFKQNLTGFLNAVVKSIAASGKLYSAHELMENIEVWFSTMSSAGNRAFRHTATIASLSTMTALAELAAERAKAAADWQRQATTERAKSRPNAGRIKDLDSRVGDATQAQQFVTEQLRDWFEAVFIHRYRDVDPAIRRDCVVALTDWILTFPDYFFDATHLRYLGWVLSDTVAATRGEVVKQLQRVYKERNRLAGLQTFTERFRARLVEIATTDAESVVRASGIELLDLLREAELLEPDDIDAVGRLVYDIDPRVRKAVGHFFAEIVDGLYKSKVDELGGEEELAEALPEASVGSLDGPSLEWLEFKSVAEMMVAYDTANDLPTNAERNRDGVLTLHAAGAESRFTLAFDALYTKIESLKDWQSIAGYLLFDHSSRRSNGVTNDPLSQLKDACVLDQKEEAVLLEAICASVKHAISDLAEKSNSTRTKLSKKQKEELSEDQEEAARHLAETIPKLLNKFGDAPNTAAAVLRMESVLNLPSLRDLRQETVTYGALLDDIRKQFMSHGTDEVLGPASEAIAHAKAYGELDDLTDDTVGTLWEDVVRNLAELIDPSTVTVRGSSDREQLSATSSNLLRITLLAQVADCTSALEDGSGLQDASASGAEFSGAIDYIIALIQRALPSEGPAIEPEDAALEDEIATRASQATLRYLEWRIHLIMTAVASASVKEIPFDELEALATRRDQFATNLYSVLQARKPTEAVSMSMAKALLELHSSAVVLKIIKARPGMRDDWEVLIMNLHATYLKAIMKVFVAAEKTYANLTNKKLEDPISLNAEDDLDAEPLDEDPLSDSESEDEEDELAGRRREAKLRKTIIAEKNLCELAGKMIFAVHAGVADASMRTRLERNKTKLGPNFKELMVYMDLGQAAKSTKSKARAKAKGKLTVNGASTKAKSNPKSNAIVAEDEIDDEIEDHEEEEQAEVGGAEVESDG